MQGLVLEGGTFRPIFSCGVMDALLELDICFPYVIGVSAGIADGVSYVSKQKGRNLEIITNYRHDKRYLGMRNYLTERSMFGLKFIYETIPNELIPFDYDTYFSNPAKVRVGVTDAKTGKPEYLDGKKIDEKCTMLKATCALPLAFPAIKLNGKDYYDGGICDPIPVRQAEKEGCDKLLIVLTRPESYRKTPSKANKLAARVLRKRYPNLTGPLLNRHEVYNEQLEYCAELERQGRAVILRPNDEVRIDSFEKDMDKIRRIYKFGHDLTIENADKIRGLMS